MQIANNNRDIISSDELLGENERQTQTQPCDTHDKDSSEQQHIVNTQDQDQTVNGDDDALGTEAGKTDHIMDENMDEKEKDEDEDEELEEEDFDIDGQGSTEETSISSHSDPR